MSPLEPWQTAWPAGLALLLVLLLVLRLHRARDLPVPGRLWWSALGLFLAVRLFALPVFSRHSFDGHEAEYWDLFRGVSSPTRGGTVLYPAMQ